MGQNVLYFTFVHQPIPVLLPPSQQATALSTNCSFWKYLCLSPIQSLPQ